MPTGGLTNQMKRRTKLVVIALSLIGFVTLLVRLFTIQLVDNEWYQQQASKQQMKETQILSLIHIFLSKTAVIQKTGGRFVQVIGKADTSRTAA